MQRLEASRGTKNQASLETRPWFYEFDVELKSQCKDWKQAEEPKIKVQCEDNVDLFSLSLGGYFYVAVLRCLRARLALVRSDLAQGAGGSFIMIMRPLTRRSLWLSFWGETQSP
ncbi:hypothetical protein QE152_g127 [Popillia japonica]|uniref:Uncharacterized protein n=1 Tax=Popillia japonica TaxID=7064 RepID=A0AAW1NDP8_POPJA